MEQSIAWTDRIIEFAELLVVLHNWDIFVALDIAEQQFRIVFGIK